MLSPQQCRRIDLRSGTHARESGRQDWRLIEWHPPPHANVQSHGSSSSSSSSSFVERLGGWTSTEILLDFQSQVSAGEASTDTAAECVHSFASGCFATSAAAVSSAPCIIDESKARTSSWLEERKESIGEGDDALYELMRHTCHAPPGGTSVQASANSSTTSCRRRPGLPNSGHPHPCGRRRPCPATRAVRYFEVWHEWHDTTTGERCRDVSPRLALSQPPPPPRILHREVPELSLYSPLMRDGLPPWWEGMQL
jgi:hypothetical protein